jgi:hypothetical protein
VKDLTTVGPACTCRTPPAPSISPAVHTEACPRREFGLGVMDAKQMVREEIDRIARLAEQYAREGDRTGLATIASRLHSIGC